MEARAILGVFDMLRLKGDWKTVRMDIVVKKINSQPIISIKMSILRRIYESLREYYETQPPQDWWPDDPMEVLIGAVLVQGTTWKSVARVLESLREKNLLGFQQLLDTEDDTLAELIRSVGFQSKKVKRLKELAALFLCQSGGNTETFFARDAEIVRRELLTVSGIGPGTADNILLYAGRVPIYMVDPFSTRILQRHGIVGLRAKEDEIQEAVHRELTPDEEPYGAKLFGEFQALMVRVGREFCDKTKPTCLTCPLSSFLSDGEPLGLKEQSTETGPTKKTGGNKKNRQKTFVEAAPRSLQEALSSSELPKPSESTKDAEPPDSAELDVLGLNETERKIVGAVSREPLPIDVLVQSLGLPIHIIRATIAILEMRRILKQVEGNQVKRLV